MEGRSNQLIPFLPLRKGILESSSYYSVMVFQKFSTTYLSVLSVISGKLRYGNMNPEIYVLLFKYS